MRPLLGMLLLVAAASNFSSAQQLRWSDEFVPTTRTGYINGGINTWNWNFHIGDGSDFGIPGWANNELQCYTNSPDNVRVVPHPDNPSDGMLVIEARVARGRPCVNGRSGMSTRDFTSAKLVTAGKRYFRWFGTPNASTPLIVHARLKVPKAELAWPAFWMLPETRNTWCSGCGAYGGWCTSGEIDIMESINKSPWSYSTIHFGGSKAVNHQQCQQRRGGRDFGTVEAAADWHNYKLRWDADEITMWVDSYLAFHATSAQWRTGTKHKASNLEAPFDQPFHFIFNIAVGGSWPGSGAAGSVPNDTVMQLLVDYIRVYEGE